MLDIKFIRDNLELVKDAARKKHIEIDLDALIAADTKRRDLLFSVEEKRAKQNEANQQVAIADADTKARLIGNLKELKDGLQKEEEALREVMREWQLLMVQVPNVPDMSVPDGETDADNVEVKKWGDVPKFSFEPKHHADLMSALDMVDLERGAKVAGFRGYFLKNDGALLNYAVWKFALDFFLKKGFTPVVAPALVRREAFLGTGYLPQGEEDLYKTQDGEYLAGTSEVAMMSYYMDEVLDAKQLPVKFFGFSDCFRREAGSHGKDTKGIFRVHEFYKLEQVVLCAASHEETVKWHEEMNRNTEEFIEALGIPYHTVLNCGADLGLGQVKKYDIELWIPSENKYREISSASYFHDFQTRRLNIRYRNQDGKTYFAHSLNATAIATPRSLIAIVENNQQADGSIKVPSVLVPYMGKDSIRKD